MSLLSDGLWIVASVPCCPSSARPLNKNREICGDHRRDLDSTPDSFNALDTCMLFSRTSVYRQPSCRFSQPHHAFRFQCEILLEPLNLQDRMGFLPHPDGRVSPDFRERFKDSSSRISPNDTIRPTVHGNSVTEEHLESEDHSDPGGTSAQILTDPDAAFTPECTQIFMEPFLRTNNLQVPQKTLSALSSSLCPPRLPYHRKPHSSRNC